MRAVLRYVLSFILVLGVAALGTIFIVSQPSAWYTNLALPAFTPPSSLFAPVWNILYILMAIAFARIWGRSEKSAKRKWFSAFWLQLLLGLLWLMFFFAFHALFLAVVDVIVLWFAVAILTLNSYDLDRLSFWLLVPYFAWITFATILSVGIWWIN